MSNAGKLDHALRYGLRLCRSEGDWPSGDLGRRREVPWSVTVHAVVAVVAVVEILRCLTGEETEKVKKWRKCLGF